MRYFDDDIIKDFSYEFKSKVSGPWTEKLSRFTTPPKH